MKEEYKFSYKLVTFTDRDLSKALVESSKWVSDLENKQELCHVSNVVVETDQEASDWIVSVYYTNYE